MDALHYERLLNPTSPDSYQAVARMYIQQGDFVSGLTADIVSALRDVYSRLPDGNWQRTFQASLNSKAVIPGNAQFIDEPHRT